MKKEKYLQAKYKKELSFFTKDNKTFREKFIAILIDLANVSEPNWDFPDIRYCTVMTLKEWDEFSRHPQRIQYKSKIKTLPRSYEGKFEFIKQILKDGYSYYRALPASKFKDTLQKSLRSLLDFSLNARYRTESMRFSDEYVGRDNDDRDDGKINPTTFIKTRLNYAVREYCRYSGRKYATVKKNICTICQGRIAVLAEYFYDYNIPDTLREDLRGIFRILRRDHTMSFASIKRGWEIWKIVHEIGLDVDSFLKLNGFPKYTEVEKKLLEFLDNKEFIKETLKHMQDELPKSYKKYIKQGYIDSIDIIKEEAKRKKKPRKPRAIKLTQKMIRESQNEVFKYFPLARRSSPRNIFINPLHPESTKRAFQSSTKNTTEKQVNVIVMAPRSDMPDSYIQALAHETTHLLHRMILDMGERSGALEKHSSERLPSSILENFSQLVEHQFAKDTKLPYKKKYHGKEFPTFYSARTTRIQVPFSLVQLGIRIKFDELWDKGLRGDITEETIWDIKNEFDQKVKQWETRGINIVREGLSAFGFFSDCEPDDGLVYMKRYITKSKPKVKNKSPQKKASGMAEAFTKHYGQEWVKSREARIILLWMLLESGRNHKIETYGKMILSKKPADCLAELKDIGIKESEI